MSDFPFNRPVRPGKGAEHGGYRMNLIGWLMLGSYFAVFVSWTAISAYVDAGWRGVAGVLFMVAWFVTGLVLVI